MKVKQSDLFFVEADLDRAGSLLNKMLIAVFLKKNVTRKQLDIMHDKFMMKTDAAPKKISYTRINTRNVLNNVEKPYSYKIFEFVLSSILELNMIEFQCSFMDLDGKKETHKVKRLTY